MTQAIRNHLMVLHYHQDLCNKLDLESVDNEYISRNDTRRKTLVPFQQISFISTMVTKSTCIIAMIFPVQNPQIFVRKIVATLYAYLNIHE